MRRESHLPDEEGTQSELSSCRYTAADAGIFASCHPSFSTCQNEDDQPATVERIEAFVRFEVRDAHWAN